MVGTAWVVFTSRVAKPFSIHTGPEDHKIHKLSQTPLSFPRISRPWKACPIFFPHSQRPSKTVRTLQRPCEPCNLCFQADPLHSSQMCLWITDFTQHVFLICTKAVHLHFSALYSETAAVLVHILCTQYNHAPLSFTSFEAIHVWCMSPCVVSSNSLPFALCWNGQDLLHAHVVNTMVKQIPKQESAQKTDPRKKQFSCQESNRWPFDNKSSTQLLST